MQLEALRRCLIKSIFPSPESSAIKVYAGYRRSVDGPTAEGNVNNSGQQPQQQQTTNAQAVAPQPAPRRFGSLGSGPVDGEREVRIAVP